MSAEPTAAVGPIEDAYPLSPLQQGMLFHTLESPGSGVYLQQLSCRVEGPLDAAAFARAWETVVARHATLRTAFEWRQLERPLQVVYRRADVPFQLEDWRALPAEAQDALWRRRLREDRARGFELDRAPLLRVTLVRLGEREHRLIWSHHHLLLDGWSVSLLLEELLAAYRAHEERREPSLPAVTPYRRYIAWLESRDDGRAAEFWRRKMEGFRAPTALAAGNGFAAGTVDVRRGEAREHYLRISAGESDALRRFVRSHGLTLNSLLQASWGLVLGRHAGAEDVVFGSTVSGRPASLRSVDRMIGLFVNTLPVRIRIPRRRSLVSWLREVQRDQHELLEHEHTPLVEVHGWTEVPRGKPLFDTILTFDNYQSGSRPTAPGGRLRFGEVGFAERTAYPLTMDVLPGEQVIVQFLYETERFDPSSILRLAGHLRNVLSGVAAGEPDRPVGSLRLLSAAEEHQLRVEWNDSAVAVPLARTINDLFDQRADERPQAIAVVSGAATVTYGELRRRRNRLAAVLAGAGREAVVAVLAERGDDFLAAMLAIFSVGAVYLPLDPTHPPARLAQVLGTSRPRLLLSDRRLAPRARELTGGLAESTAPRIVDLAACRDPGPPDEPALRSTPAGPPALAYAIYTSGSSGRPKGAMVTHGGMVNHLFAKLRDLRLGADDRVAQTASQGFDVSVWQFLAPLAVGGVVEVVDTETAQDPECLLTYAERSRCTVLETVPSLLRAYLSADGGDGEDRPARPAGALRCLLSTGEALPPEVRDAWFRAHPEVGLVNAYGPTECSDDVTHAWLAAGEAGSAAPVPIGRPVVNTTLHVLDADGSRVPVAVAGELYVGGEGVGRGYLDDPARTAPVFLPDPFTGGGARLYRTGDRVRWRPDGTLDYLGRIDRQVKIRGIRMELGEIEAVLAERPEVEECAVRLWEVAPGDERLVAYAVPRAGATLDEAEVRGFLRRVLPEAVVPSAVVLLDAMPRNANGKLDRSALPEPAWNGAADAGGQDLRGPTEELVAGIWSRVLGVERVVRRDSFFALGGHSLSATRIVARIREVFSVEIALRDLFEAPSVAALARRIDRALRAGEETRPPIRPAGRDGPLPLSFGQERLWFIAQLDPESSAYNIPRIVRLRGDLDLGALAGALGEVVRRHAVLRLRFVADDGVPRQVATAPVPAAPSVVDLSGLPPAQGERAVRRWTLAESRRPFDLAGEPPFRATVYRLGERDHVGGFVMHHIASDGWSMGVLVSEVVTLYDAFSRDRPSPLPELGLQYADFALWQRGWLTGETLEREIGYWRELLAGSPSTLELPTDRPRPPVHGPRGALLSFTVPDDLVARVTALSREEWVTPFILLLAGFQALLARYSYQERFNLGTLTAGREHPGTEELIGFFVNTLVLPADLSGQPSYRELLGRVREVILGVHAHQDVPFEKLVEELDPRRSLSRTPLFQVMFQLLVEQRPRAGVENLRMSAVEADTATAPFDLLLTLSQSGDRLRGSFRYATDLFDATTVRRLARHFVALQEAALEDPDRPLADLSVLTSQERHQAVTEWSGSVSGPARAATLVELFAAQAERTPDAVAVASAAGQVSYGALAAGAERVAHRLRRRGARRGEVVAIAAPRSPEMVAGLLGILRSGAAYLPLDLDYPDERLAGVLADSGARLALVSRGLEARFAAFGVVPVALGDSPEEIAPPESGEDPRQAAGPGDLAYLIYTSGSTGKPKGVAIEHRSAAAFLAWCGSFFAGGDLDRVLASTSICFDLSVFELFAPLVHGGRVVLVDRILALADDSSEAGLSLVNTVPSAMAELVQLAGAARSTRTIALAGEPLLRSLAERLFREAPQARLLNLYGPSEDTTYSTAAVVPRGVTTPPTIGRPIAGTRAYLVDPRLRPAPLGVPGELLLGGDGLARGYLARPRLTAERFVPDPFGPSGERLYRTGDLCRFEASGELTFLGRSDRQVKLRGYRIELQEIETILSRHPAVSQAIVEVRRRSPAAPLDDRILVAYLTPAAGARPDTAELRRVTARSLPDHMIPAEWMVLEAFPALPSGKVDRGSLPDPSPPGDTAGEESSELFEDPVQGLVAAVWAQVLGLEAVGPTSDFFALGGHSLLAVRLIARLRDAFGVEIPLRRLFETPTVAGLAAVVSEALRAGRRAPLAPLQPVPRDRPAPLSFAQQRLWLLDRLNPSSAVYSIPAFFRLGGPVALAALARALTEVVRRHEALRTTFVESGGEVHQVVSPPPGPHLPVIDLSGLGRSSLPREAVRLGQEEAARPFDLAEGPLFRTGVLRLGEDDHAVLATMHHIVSDGWSMRLLAREVSTLYAAFQEGRQPLLPELPIQYADFAHWQREVLTGSALEEGLAYWRERLAPVADMPLALPTDRPRPRIQSFAGASRGFAVPPPVARALAGLGIEERATSFMVLSAAFYVLLARYSGQRWIAVGTPSAGRDRPEVESLIGCFVNTLVLAVEVGDDPPIRELVGRVREATLAAYIQQDVPFERVVEELEPRRDLARSPLFQVMFMMQDAVPEDRKPRQGGLDLQPLAVGARTAKFDLSVTLSGGAASLRGAVVYATALFDPSTIARMVDHYRRILAEVAAHPGRRLSELALLSSAERHQVLSEYVDGGEPRADRRGLAARIRAVAEDAPDRVAVVDGEAHVTYSSLLLRSWEVAARLRHFGVGPGRRVGVALDRSTQLLTALLGAVESGGAYVPLDPGDPPERLAHVARDARLSALVVSGKPGFDAGQVPLLDLAATGGRGRPEPPPGPAPYGDEVAYVIYTSGSTGVPKGVEVSHDALARYLDWAAAAYRSRRPARSLVHTSISFDFTVTPLWLPLVLGGTTELLPAKSGLIGLAERLRRSPGFALLKLTPSHLDLLAAEAAGGEVDLGGAADVLVLGGEELLPRQVALCPRGSAARIVNEYGPTEATVGCVVHEVTEPAGPVPIGRPIPGCRALVLDARLRPCPPGIPGELLLAGACLARGYLGRPASTAERFVPDPSAAVPGGRAYRTGDLVRWRRDGALAFLGRIDDQVKVRGLRVEPAEVAAVLSAHPGVREAVVTVEASGTAAVHSLTAFVTTEAELDSGELRRHLSERLPPAMIPGRFVRLERLPLAASGKLDRSALRELARTSGDGSQREVRQPRSFAELRLQRIWEELLDVPEVSIDDDFFALGGHSLLAVRLMGRVREELGIELPLDALFTAPTIEALAQRTRSKLEPSERIAVVLAADPRSAAEEPLFCVHPVGGTVFCYADLARRLASAAPIYGLQVPHGPGQEQLPETIEGIAERYLPAVREVRAGGPFRLAGWSIGALIAFEMARALTRSGEEVEVLVLLDAPAPRRFGRTREPDRRERILQFARDLAGLGGKRRDRALLDADTLTGEEPLEALFLRARQAGLVPPDVGFGELEALYRVFEIHLLAAARYRPRRLSGSIDLFVSEERAARARQPDLGWGRLASDGVRVHRVPGDHYSILVAPGVEALAARLRDRLQGILPRSAKGDPP
jgi:amino acid adenylation domain-containing protein